MTFPLKQMPSPGKRNRGKLLEEDNSNTESVDTNLTEKAHKVRRYDLATIMGSSTTTTNPSILNRNRIYNIGVRKKPAELFRKDLISAMKMPDSDQLNPEEYLLITDPWKEEWEKGVQVPVNPDSLPGPSIHPIDESHQIKHPHPLSPSSSSSPSPSKKSSAKNVDSTKKSSISPSKKKSIPLKKFEPERDPSASKYELDLTDAMWLETLTKDNSNIDNHHREEHIPNIAIPECVFEEIMNELEYNCAKNMKAKHVGIEFDDHIACDVCKSLDAEDGNEMVFCDSCNICVHQACYGISIIPDGEWKCKPCTDIGNQKTQKSSVSCILCPNTGGAFKPTSTNKWAHVSCALWVPEVSIGCVTTMEPITKVKSIPSSRWQLICSLCNIRQGAPIQCSVPTCKTAYHVTCAFDNNLKMRAIIGGDNKGGVNLKSYCPKHSEETNNIQMYHHRRRTSISSSDSTSNEFPLSRKEEIDIANPLGNMENDKNNRFWMYIDLNEINRVLMHKKSSMKELKNISDNILQMYIDLVLQYWKLKRTSNCGLPLIKVVTADTIEEIEHARRNDILRLRVNLERIRNLSYMISRREKLKRSWLVSHYTSICKIISMTTGTSIIELLDDSMTEELSPSKYQSSPVRQLFVSDDKMALVKNVIHSNVIYAPDLNIDKLRAKKVLKDLNRWIELEKLRKRKPNPYAKTFVPVKRSGSMSGSSSGGSGDVKVDIVSMFDIKKSPHSPNVPSCNFPHKKSTTPFHKRQPMVNGGSSILLKSQNLSPAAKRSLFSDPEPILSHCINRGRNLSPARSPTSSTENNIGTSILVKSSGSIKKSSTTKNRPMMNGISSSSNTRLKASSRTKTIVPNGRSHSIDDEDDDDDIEDNGEDIDDGQRYDSEDDEDGDYDDGDKSDDDNDSMIKCIADDIITITRHSPTHVSFSSRAKSIKSGFDSKKKLAENFQKLNRSRNLNSKNTKRTVLKIR